MFDIASPPPPVPPSEQRTSTPAPASRTDFTFRSHQPYPTNHDRESGMELDGSTTASTPSTTGETPPIRVLSRSNRSRHNNHTRHRGDNGNRTTTGPTINFNLASGAGSKRKIPYPDFFDISGLDNNRQPDRRGDGNGGGGGGGGGKRGRFV